MKLYSILTILISLSAVFAYINHRFIKMPFVIGLFFLSSILSVIVLISRFWIKYPFLEFKEFVEKTHISDFILEVMLGFLLFAGSFDTRWVHLKKFLKQISLFAILGVILSTIIIAFLFDGIFLLLNIPIDLIYCLLFGALISPTDPIAVLGILKEANVPQKIESIIVGESLFNDGVGVVIFIALLEILQSGSSTFEISHFALLFIQEALGGVLFGLGLGYLLHLLLRSINHYETEVLLTIAFVMVGYNFCQYVHVSGALAMVVMGLFVGNYKQEEAMSDVTQEYVHKFWELVDVILNAVLFILIALVIVVIDFKAIYLLVGLSAIIIMLISRTIVVYIPKKLFPKFMALSHQEAKIIIWGGLRGGLSIALVLSLPESETKNVLLIATYSCVVFSILVKGLSIGNLAKKIL